MTTPKRRPLARVLPAILALALAATFLVGSGGAAHAASAMPTTNSCAALAYGWDGGAHDARYQSYLSCSVGSPDYFTSVSQAEELQECQGWDGNQNCTDWVYVGNSLHTCYGTPPYVASVSFWCPSINVWDLGGLGGQELRVQSFDHAVSHNGWNNPFYEYSSTFVVAL